MSRISPDKLLRDLQLPRAVGQLQPKEPERELFLFTPLLGGRLLRKLAFDVPVSAIDSAQPYEYARQPRIFVVYFKPELDSTLKDKVFIYSELREEFEEGDDDPVSDESPDWEEAARHEDRGECPCCGAPMYGADRDNPLPRFLARGRLPRAARRWIRPRRR